MSGSRPRRSLKALPTCLILLACLLAAAMQHVVSERGDSGAEGEDGDAWQGERDAVDELVEGGFLPSQAIDSSGSDASGRNARSSSLSDFLDDLEVLQAGEGACASITFRENRDLPSLAADVLREYADIPSVDLIASGYLDLKGNVWGAVLRGGASWCDVLLVSTQDDAESCVQVTRVLPEGAGT